MTRARDVANIDGILTTTGDTFYASAAATPARLGVGSTGQVLTVSGGVPSWATPASGSTFAGCQAYNNNFSLSYTQYAEVLIQPLDAEKFDSDGYHSTVTNSGRITIPTGKGGKYIFNFTGFLGTQNTYANVQPKVNGSAYLDYFGFQFYTSFSGTANGRFSGSVLMTLNAGDYVEVYYSSDKTTGTITGCYATFGCVYLGA